MKIATSLGPAEKRPVKLESLLDDGGCVLQHQINQHLYLYVGGFDGQVYVPLYRLTGPFVGTSCWVLTGVQHFKKYTGSVTVTFTN